MERTWKVGDSYEIVEDGTEVMGHIVKIDEQGYHVVWTGPEGIVCGESIEDQIDPRVRRVSY